MKSQDKNCQGGIVEGPSNERRSDEMEFRKEFGRKRSGQQGEEKERKGKEIGDEVRLMTRIFAMYPRQRVERRSRAIKKRRGEHQGRSTEGWFVRQKRYEGTTIMILWSVVTSLGGRFTGGRPDHQHLQKERPLHISIWDSL